MIRLIALVRQRDDPKVMCARAIVMQTLQGIAVSPGVAIGEALVVDNQGFPTPRRQIPPSAVEDELARLGDALAAVADQLIQRRDAVTSQLGTQYGAIFSAHHQMVSDPQLTQAVRTLVTQQRTSAEYAVSSTLREYARVFEQLGSSYMAERAHDIIDIEKLLLDHLLGEQREDFSRLSVPVIILAHRLTPSETSKLNRDFVRGFVTEVGGAGGHTAIVAEALGIPAVVGLGAFLPDTCSGEQIIVDGDHGNVVLRPDETALRKYREEVEHHDELVEVLSQLREMPAQTTDGVRIRLQANIEFPSEVDTCVARGADGIGLFRTEFLYLGGNAEPSEEEQYLAYSQVADAMKDRPVIVRTQDLGADKLTDLPREPQRNSMLGLRSIRLSLRDTDAFRIQLRAILRASATRNLRVMFPMISTRRELLQAKQILGDVMRQLDDDGIEFDHQIPVGMMVEVPAVVVVLHQFVEEIDFISIGTNDLIQYALAVDRGDKDVAGLYNAADPAVLRLIQMTIQAADAAGIESSLCGQMSANPKYTMLLLGLGLRRISVPPLALPEIKKVCRSVTMWQCEEVASRAMEMNNPDDIKRFLAAKLKQAVPELIAHV